MARKFGQMLDCEMAVMNKTRPAHDQAAISQVIAM